MTLSSATVFNDVKEAQKLIDGGADVNEQSEYGSNLLHTAANHGSYEVAELLLSYGAKPSLAKTNDYGSTPLHVAASFGYARIARLFVDSGANVTLRDTDDKTPADQAQKNLASAIRSNNSSDWSKAFEDEKTMKKKKAKRWEKALQQERSRFQKESERQDQEVLAREQERMEHGENPSLFFATKNSVNTDNSSSSNSSSSNSSSSKGLAMKKKKTSEQEMLARMNRVEELNKEIFAIIEQIEQIEHARKEHDKNPSLFFATKNSVNTDNSSSSNSSSSNSSSSNSSSSNSSSSSSVNSPSKTLDL